MFYSSNPSFAIIIVVELESCNNFFVIIYVIIVLKTIEFCFAFLFFAYVYGDRLIDNYNLKFLQAIRKRCFVEDLLRNWQQQLLRCECLKIAAQIRMVMLTKTDNIYFSHLS
jgi:hypothetical protein